MKTKLSIQQKRTLAFLLAILFYTISFYAYFRKMNGQSSTFLNLNDLLGLLALDRSVSYKNEEQELKIHSLIEGQITGNTVSTYSKIATTLTLINVAGIYFAVKAYLNLGYVSVSNKGFIIMLHFLFFLTYSFWLRRDQLEKIYTVK